MRKLKYFLISSFITILLIITVPVILISYALLPYNNIYYSKEYHSYQDPTTIDIMNVDVDIGNVEINYIPYAIDFSVKIDIEYQLSGILEGTSFSDFFEIKWDDVGNILNFSIHIKDGINLETIISQAIIKNINILLQASISCEINVFVRDGNVTLETIYGITLGNIFTNLSSGNIQFRISYCYINGNITAKVQNGYLQLELCNCEYLKNLSWLLSTEKGNVAVNLEHEDNIVSNITGTISTHFGNYRISYIDRTTEVGALFILGVNQNDTAIHQQLFESIGFDFNQTSVNGNDVYHVYSNDFPTSSNYRLNFTMPVGVYEDIYFRNLLN